MPFQKGHKLGVGKKNWLGKHHTEETKLKLSLTHMGITTWIKDKHHSEETKEKIRQSHLGMTSSEEAKKKMSIAGKGRKLSEETKLKMGLSRLGTHRSDATKLKMSNALTGRIFTEEWKIKMRLNHADFKGEKHPNWKGGISPINERIRKSYEYKNWRIKVYKKDYYTCQLCGYVGKKLHAHHIKSFSDYPELRFEISNGITYCKVCHENNGFHKGLRLVMVA